MAEAKKDKAPFLNFLKQVGPKNESWVCLIRFLRIDGKKTELLAECELESLYTPNKTTWENGFVLFRHPNGFVSMYELTFDQGCIDYVAWMQFDEEGKFIRGRTAGLSGFRVSSMKLTAGDIDEYLEETQESIQEAKKEHKWRWDTIVRTRSDLEEMGWELPSIIPDPE